MRIRNLKANVLAILEAVPESRDSDIRLMIEVWRRYYPQRIKKGSTGEEGVWLKDLYDLPREDNVKRVRAQIQNVEHQFLPTSWSVAKQRKIEEDRWRVAMGYPPKDKGVQPIGL